MSSANAAAKKRRAPADPPTQNKLQPAMQPVGQGINQSMNSPGLTLPQVISVIDKRLITLETFMVESKRTVQFSNLPTPPTTMNQPSPSMDEFNSRFEILANEIANMKNIILSLQTYTMDVNKMLMEERIRMVSNDAEFETEEGVEVEKDLEISNA